MKSATVRVFASGLILLFFAAVTLTSCGKSNEQAEQPPAEQSAAATLRIDSHAHYYLEKYDASVEAPFIAMLRKNNMKWFDICTIGLKWEHLQAQVEAAKILHAAYPENFSWATSFNLENWGAKDWEQTAIAYIQNGFDNGAVAVKVWKEIGMELKDPNGKYVMIDDPRFAPIFAYVESKGKTLVSHLGEPRNCWLPLEEMTVDGDRGYFKEHPQYHAFLHPEIPSYEAQIAARDSILARHPNLRMVGCHLGSLEYDTDELAKRLDLYPNFAVDTAERIIHFKVQDREKVRAFCIKYQDRILYGTDLSITKLENIDATLASMDKTYAEDYAYFSTGGDFVINERTEPIKGLDLPPEVVKKIFYTNAVKWYPGI